MSSIILFKFGLVLFSLSDLLDVFQTLLVLGRAEYFIVALPGVEARLVAVPGHRHDREGVRLGEVLLGLLIAQVVGDGAQSHHQFPEPG